MPSVSFFSKKKIWPRCQAMFRYVFLSFYFCSKCITKHSIRKVKFVSKNSILTKLYNFLGKSMLSTTKKCKSPTFSRVFHPIFFWQFFQWNQSFQQLKSPKPQHFHEFSPKTIRQFSPGNESWIFGQRIKISNSSVRWNEPCQWRSQEAVAPFLRLPSWFAAAAADDAGGKADQGRVGGAADALASVVSAMGFRSFSAAAASSTGSSLVDWFRRCCCPERRWRTPNDAK